MLRKIKPKLSELKYKVLYPSGSSPGKFYGTVKIHKVPKNGNIDQLPIRPIASNLNNYIPTSKTLIKDIITFERIWIHHYKFKTFYGDNKTQGIEGFQMLSFDVKSLFTIRNNNRHNTEKNIQQPWINNIIDQEPNEGPTFAIHQECSFHL